VSLILFSIDLKFCSRLQLENYKLHSLSSSIHNLIQYKYIEKSLLFFLAGCKNQKKESFAIICILFVWFIMKKKICLCDPGYSLITVVNILFAIFHDVLSKIWKCYDYFLQKISAAVVPWCCFLLSWLVEHFEFIFYTTASALLLCINK